MYYLNDEEKRDSMNADQLDFLRKTDSESRSIKRSSSVPQQPKIDKPNQSKACQNILLAATVLQFFVIISACTAFAFFGYSICDTTTVKSTLKGKVKIQFAINILTVT